MLLPALVKPLENSAKPPSGAFLLHLRFSLYSGLCWRHRSKLWQSEELLDIHKGGWKQLVHSTYLRVIQGEEEDLRVFHSSNCCHQWEIRREWWIWWEWTQAHKGKGFQWSNRQNKPTGSSIRIYRERVAWWARSVESSCQSERRDLAPLLLPCRCTALPPTRRPPCPRTAPAPSAHR